MSKSQTDYDRWHRSVGSHEGPAYTPQDPWHHTVARLLPDLNGLRVLEIGCGRGDFALWLKRKFPAAEMTAVDFSPAAIEIARARRARPDDVQFEVADAQSLHFSDSRFDLIFSCECLEHVPEPERMTSEMRRLLTPGGRFILTTENYLNGMLMSWARTWLFGVPFNSGAGVQPHENFFLYWRVKRLMERSGLCVDHMESNHLQWLLLPRTDPARLCTKDFRSPLARRLFRPFGRHFTFCGFRPNG